MSKSLKLLLVLTIALKAAVAQSVTFPAVPLRSDSLAAIANKGMPAGMDIYIMARVATEHHYPLPEDVLNSHSQLELDAAQLNKINALVKTLNLKKLEISRSVVANEKTLNQLFANRKLNDGSIIFYGNRYGLYEGEMRTAVLTACYQTAQVLTPRQLTKFEQIKNHNN